MSNVENRKWIMVTGAAGFIAYHAIESLLKSGKAVVGVDNFDPFYDRLTKEANLRDLRAIARETGTPFEFSVADICSLEPAFRADLEISDILHLAAKAGVRPSLLDPEAYLRANVQGTLRLLEFARKRGIRHFAFGSSSSVYGDSTPVPFSEAAPVDQPVSPYAATKRACELFCRNYSHLYGVSVASLRFFTVYGPRQRPDLAIHKFTRQIAGGERVTLYGDGGTERDYTYVSDIIGGVSGALRWLEGTPPGAFEIFNLGGSRTTSLKRLVELIEMELGIQARIEWAPMQPGDVFRTYASVERAQRYLGYAPQVPIEEGIARFVEWYRRANPGLFGVGKRAA